MSQASQPVPVPAIGETALRPGDLVWTTDQEYGLVLSCDPETAAVGLGSGVTSRYPLERLWSINRHGMIIGPFERPANYAAFLRDHADPAAPR